MCTETTEQENRYIPVSADAVITVQETIVFLNEQKGKTNHMLALTTPTE